MASNGRYAAILSLIHMATINTIRIQLRRLYSRASIGLMMLSSMLAADEYDNLRDDWEAELIAQASGAGTVATRASNYQSSINTNPSVAEFYLWSDLPLGSASSNIVATYKRLEDMAMAWALPSSSLYGDSTLSNAIVTGLDWMHSNVYKSFGGQYDNWYHWEISGPQALCNTIILIYPALSSTQIDNYCAAIDNYGPESANASPYFTWDTLTSANTSDVALVGILRGIIGKNSIKLTSAKDNLSKVFDYTTVGDGLYSDGSYVFHNNVAYTGQYGTDLLEGVADIVSLLKDSSWRITDPDLANIYAWAQNGVAPFIYNGALMDMVRGRAISWSSTDQYKEGEQALAAIRKVTSFAPEPTATELSNFLDTPRFTSGQFHFPNMARIVALRENFGFGLSMSSSRIANYEHLFYSSNLKGWFTGDGMTYLYLGETDSQFIDSFWPTIDYYHLPGTTVEMDYIPQSGTTDQSWVGGAKINSSYGLAGMALHPANSSSGNSTLYGKKIVVHV